MARQSLIWTVLPYGRVPDGEARAGQLRVTAMLAPRLTPEAPEEQSLAAFPDFLDWPDTLAQADFGLTVGAQTLQLVPLGTPDSTLWQKLFDATTPVSGFVFKDMSAVNMRSYPVRHVLGTLRRHYSQLAVQAASNHPTLLPWKQAHPNLKDLLEDLGTRTISRDFGNQSIEFPLPGFSRFFDDRESQVEERLRSQVFGPKSVYETPVSAPVAEEGQLPPAAQKAKLRVLPPDWYDPRPGGPNTPLVATKDAQVMDQFHSEAEYALYQANRFYRREPPTEAERMMRFPTYNDIAPPPKLPDYDFHRIVASYGSYSDLLRALGLILDFAVDGAEGSALDNGTPVSNGNMALRVKWSNGRDDSGDGYPRTAWRRDKERFTARARRGDLARGLLRLEHSDDSWGLRDKRSDFDVYQVDPDGASLKTVGFTLTAQNLVAKSLDLARPDGLVTYTTGDRQPVAALRSGGLGVSRHGRAELVAQDAAAAALKNQEVENGNAGSVVFFAEDLLRGYRIDVSPVSDPVQPGKWFSLCARLGDYHLIRADEDITFGPDEGYVSGPSATSSDTGADPDDYYMHESMFRWTGWSLCAPRPGRTIRSGKVDGTELQTEEPADVTDRVEDGNGIAASYKVLKGSLPRLRFGQLYRLRARYVDAAGNSLDLNDPTLGELEQASDAVGYWRFEPVDPPTLVGRARLSEGESLERMVIRSDYDQTPESYLETQAVKDAVSLPPSQDFEYTPVNERHVVPAKASQQQCETHGLFDPYFAQWDKIKTGYAIAAREAGTIFDQAAGATVELITPASLSEVAKATTVPPALPSGTEPVGERLVGGQYVIHREAQVTTPYLPDGAAAGVAIRAMPGGTIPGVTQPGVIGPGCIVMEAPNQELVLLVAYAKDWPDSTGFRIVMAERKANLTEIPCNEAFPDDGLPHWDDDARTLTFFVSKGRIERLRYASFLDKEYVETFGIVAWASAGPDRKFVSEMALLGCHWMLTPFRELTLVHATQHPVCLPLMTKTQIKREVGAQFATIDCPLIQLHGPSTGKFEVLAEWFEWNDDINQPEPRREHRRGQLGEVMLAENHSNTVNLAVAVADQNHDPARPRAPQNRHELGDTRFRLIKYKVQASTRFREYLQPAIYANPDLVTRIGPFAEGPAVKQGVETDAGAPVLRDPSGGTDALIVPASAPPDDPRVLYVVPTFRWKRKVLQDGADVTRLGNGLRVWLDRPWFSSGDGEMLGVILHKEGGKFTDVPDRMQTLVTQWGMDPMWETVLPKWRASASDFPARVHVQNVTLQEMPNAPQVAVVGHRVHWDGARSLWYCDIELEPGSTYMPFVRMALVRYQPNALRGQEISKVVTAEFAQVLPRRRAVFSLSRGQVSLKVHGPVPTGGPMKFNVDSPHLNLSLAQGPHDTGRNRFELVLQERDPEIDSDLGWKDVKVLRSAVVGGGADGPIVTPGPAGSGGLFADAAIEARLSRDVVTQAGTTVTLDASLSRTIDAVGSVTSFFDPAIWNVTTPLETSGGIPQRLMLREFERYYTDEAMLERIGRMKLQRRLVEERLVYATVLDLG